MKTKPHYPGITVQLTGEDGNAFAILGRVADALKKGGVEPREIDRFLEEAKAGSYDDLLRTCLKWVDVE